MLYPTEVKICLLDLSVAISWLGAYIIHDILVMVNTRDTFPKPYSIFFCIVKLHFSTASAYR